jgi:hypothetical protein
MFGHFAQCPQHEQKQMRHGSNEAVLMLVVWFSLLAVEHPQVA